MHKKNQFKDLLISIIIPVYNREFTVGRAIQSVLNQTYSNFELIIVDDASTDGTAEIINSFQDSRIRFFQLKKNQGAPAARNFGINQANGEWIAFQDSDDVWLPDKLEKQIEIIKKLKKPCIVYTSFYRYKQGKVEYIPDKKDRRNKSGIIHKELLLGNFITTQTVLAAKECLVKVGGFAVDMPRLQDWELWLRLSKFYPFYWIDEPLVDVFYTEQSISSEPDKLITAYHKIWEKHEPLFKQAGTKYLASFLFSYGHNLCLAGQMKTGRKYLAEAFCNNFTSVKYAIAWIVSIFGYRLYKFLYSLYND